MFHKMLNIIIIHSLCCSFHNVVRFKCNAYRIKGQIEQNQNSRKKVNINIEWRKYRINKYYDSTKNKDGQKTQDIGRDVEKADPTSPINPLGRAAYCPWPHLPPLRTLNLFLFLHKFCHPHIRWDVHVLCWKSCAIGVSVVMSREFVSEPDVNFQLNGYISVCHTLYHLIYTGIRFRYFSGQRDSVNRSCA